MKQIAKRTVVFLLTLILAASLLFAVIPGASAAETLEERQQAVVTVALAYFDRGQSVQYDGTTLVTGTPRKAGGKTRSTNSEAPEYATPNETLFSVCSDFAHHVYYEAFRYNTFGSAGATGTIAFIDEKAVKILYLYDKETGKDVKEAIHEMFTMVQPGDILTTRSTAGHAMIYVGDVFGDGVKYLAHCFGAGFKMDTGKDNREYPYRYADADPRYGIYGYSDSNGGAIRLTPNAEESFVENYGKGTQNRISLVRPLALDEMTPEKYPITSATRYRMAHPRLSIERMLNKSRFRSVETGETLTLSLKLSNSSKQAYSVDVTEKIPAGVSLKKAPEGWTAAGDTLTAKVELPAGGEKAFAFEYTVTAARGTQIVFTDGSVGDIPSNTLQITVGGKKLTAEDEARLAAVAKGDYDKVLKDSKATAETLGSVVYKKILGLNVEFPAPKQIYENLTEERAFSGGKVVCATIKAADKVAEADRFAYQMMVPTFHGGRQLWNEWGHERCNDPKDMHMEPGDVVIRVPDVKKLNAFDTLVYLGGGKYLQYQNGKQNPYAIVEEPELVRSLQAQMFFNLRPTLAYDDVHALAGSAEAPAAYKLPFTDVKESDWYFEYVRDLVRDGTVSGMTATTFEPNGNLTYGQALKLIAIAAGQDAKEKTGSHWASGYLALAKTNKWLEEDVNLDAKITREAFCSIAAKSKKLKNKLQANPFTDTTSDGVQALYGVKVINGMTATTFEPNSLLTRAQISKIIWSLRKVKW